MSGRDELARSSHSDIDVVIGILTHRRPELLRSLLGRLGELRFSPGSAPRLQVLVVDNSPGLEAKPVVECFAADLGPGSEYVPLGAGNIAAGRNEVLRRARDRAPLLALIDDDELPDPDWLQRLLDAHGRTSADVVTGPVVAVYPAEAPAWLKRSIFHSTAGSPVPVWVSEAYTSNVLLETALFRRCGLQFDPVLGTSGGEDQLFFRQAVHAGARIFWEPTAVVREPVPPERLSVRYLLRREYRKGGTLGLLDRSRPGWPPGRPFRRALSGVFWGLTGGGAALVGALTGSRASCVSGLMRAARAAGMFAGLRGRTYDLYRRPATEGAGMAAE
ncbi:MULTISPECIES: glycosyltransferase family 2 protein [unclassified Modestobacter]